MKSIGAIPDSSAGATTGKDPTPVVDNFNNFGLFLSLRGSVLCLLVQEWSALGRKRRPDSAGKRVTHD